ncbi:MAG TPA: GH3 auxin-responsive promoter, partial [Algoriphagus sp.]|nr:GH3 auxin-responsive promoter [Algoriphagus sp.]
YKNLFAHHWYIGTNDAVDAQQLGERIDVLLKELNDDYAVERRHALKKVFCEVRPSSDFYDWMRSQGKEGGQNKFPRVLKGEKAESWRVFLKKKGADF